MNFKCIHISDVHFRGLKRHDEYITVFKNLFKKAKELKPNIIFIGGDIVHSKTQGISPEIIDILTWWFKSLAAIAPTHIILGNHDGLILNENRQDAITPIINAIDNPDLFLYKKSGVYPTGIDGFNWCVFSCFDEEGWKNVKPIENEINIACFHGGVLGSLTDTDWNINGEVALSFFDGYDFGFLGDIHKVQYLDDEKRIAYPGSTIQQNYGEDIKKGFLYWEIDSKYNYNSTFYSIENPNPFVTIDWKNSIQETILFAKVVKNNCKFRVRHKNNISQAEIKILHEYLKEDKNAKEIVYQKINAPSKKIDTEDSDNEIKFNIRSESDRVKLLSDYFYEEEESFINEVNNLYRKQLDKIPSDKFIYNNKKWSINNMNFENTFGYGKNNYINFNNLSGIVGIFGNNRCGKSSIPGTLMYGLFNTTDRGSIKNQYIVNTRKGHCTVNIDFSCDGIDYNILRKTTKKTNKKNKISTNTSLSLTNNSGEELSDKTEEQRRETEKVLRNIIGTSEDFLYTTFASQGEMNTFIKEKSSSRKKILSKFLNLEIYEDLHKMSRDDYIVLKSKLKSFNEKNWQSLILENKTRSVSLEVQNKKIENDILDLRDIELNKKVELEKINSDSKNIFLIEKRKNDLKIKNSKLLDNISSINNFKKLQEENIDKLNKISTFKKQFPIEELEKSKEKLTILNKQLSDLDNSLDKAKTSQKVAENKIKILDDVPCGDMFKSCKFIKDAHESKSNIELLKKASNDILGSILEVKDIIKNLNYENIEEKIKKYNNIKNREYEIKLNQKSISEKIQLLSKHNIDLKEEIEKLNVILSENNSSKHNEFIIIQNKIKAELSEVSKMIYKKEKEKEYNLQDIIKINSENKILLEEENEYENLIKSWKVLDAFTKSVSKKGGIPTLLINSCLPKINKEIEEILRGVCNFKIEILEDESNSNLNIYIDYGDSKRILECGSGMEKMMASIAIRVALINISSLPKSDMFIIDEGFGALDDSNIEACGRLLESLKKYFKSIIIISHVDSIKDIVDTTLDIAFKGKDSYVRFE